jgi:sugar O-acyltransferase (sialic acid O-acetyltransferase NeuD family)
VSRRPLVIIGAGGHGRELLDILETVPADERPELLGFLSDFPVDDTAVWRRGHEVLGSVDALVDLDADYVLAVGDAAARRSIDAGLQSLGRTMVSLVHPCARCEPGAVAGPGLVMAAGAHLGSGAVVGRGVHLNTNAVVRGRARLGDHVTVSPGAVVEPGAVVASGVFIGAGALIATGAAVGEEATVGAGAVVVVEVLPHGVAIGSPATARPRG